MKKNYCNTIKLYIILYDYYIQRFNTFTEKLLLALSDHTISIVEKTTEEVSLLTCSFYFPDQNKNAGFWKHFLLFFLKEWLAEGCVEQTSKKMAYCVANFTINEAAGVCRCTGNATFDSMVFDTGFNCTNATYQGDSPVPVAQFFFE